MNMKAQGRKESSATNSRNFRTFLLMAQLESQEIGQRIAQARKEAGGMTQEELSDLLGVTTRSVQGYEAGDVIPYRHFSQLGEIFSKAPRVVPAWRRCYCWPDAESSNDGTA